MTAFLDHALPPATRQGAEAHLRACRECRTELKALDCTRRLLQRLPREPMPYPLKTEILEAFRHGTTTERLTRSHEERL